MVCPNCPETGWLRRVKILAKNTLLRVCNECSLTWIEGSTPSRVTGIKLSDFIKSHGIDRYSLIDIAEEPGKKS